MSSGASFTSLPREIRDQIYKEILVSSKPEYTFHTTFLYNNPIGPRQALLNSAFSNSQIAREACEVYYGYNAFAAHAAVLEQFLACKLYLGGGKRFFPAMCVRKIVVTIDFIESAMSDSLAVNFRGISLSCPKLQTVILRCSANEENGAIFVPRCTRVIDIKNIIYLCRRLKSEISGIQLKLYLPGFCYNRVHLSPQTVDAQLGPCKILKDKDVSWLMDEPDQETIENLKKGEGTIREWLMAKMARKWAPIKERTGFVDSDEEYF
ncbi:hypothetical protein MMC29_000471 [Sticta canariensis]|nr:hypothetical protein [Sticta canariensis]